MSKTANFESDQPSQDQALALTMSAWLWASTCLAVLWGVGCLLLVWYSASGMGWRVNPLCALLWLLSLLGGYVLFRVVLDARLFKYLGQGQLSPATMDQALAQIIRSRGNALDQPFRSMADRVQGAQRWLFYWVVLVVLQWCLVGWLVMSK